jgi:uncharacterized protein (TIGR03067 family)
MAQITQILLCLGLVLSTTGCGTKKTSADLDTERLQGAWDLVYQQISGKKVPDENGAALFHGRMVFIGNKIHYTVELPGFDFEFAYNLQPNQQPKAIDLEITNTPDKKGIKQKFLGIYLLEHDSLKICYNKTERPTGFNAEEGSHNVLIVLKRAAPM